MFLVEVWGMRIFDFCVCIGLCKPALSNTTKSDVANAGLLWAETHFLFLETVDAYILWLTIWRNQVLMNWNSLVCCWTYIWLTCRGHSCYSRGPIRLHVFCPFTSIANVCRTQVCWQQKWWCPRATLRLHRPFSKWGMCIQFNCYCNGISVI